MKYCFGQLLEAVIATGTCKVRDNPAFNPELTVWNGPNGKDASCICDPGTGTISCSTAESEYDHITEGSCQSACRNRLFEDRCLEVLKKQPTIIQETIMNLIKYSADFTFYLCMECEIDPVSLGLSCTDAFMDTCSTTNTGKKRRRRSLKRQQVRLAPVSHVETQNEIHTELNFNNTRHRYPWICSLRTKGITAEHICTQTSIKV